MYIDARMKAHFRPRIGPFLTAVLLLAAGGWMFGNSLHNPFVFDDRTVIEHNKLLRDPAQWPQFFRGAIDSEHRFDGGYRPLPMLTLGLNYYFSHLDVAPYRAVNLLLHIFNAWLLAWLAFLLLRDGGAETDPQPPQGTLWPWLPPLLIALYFLGHPAQTMSINFIWKRTGILSAMWMLLAALAYWRFLRRDSRLGYGLTCLAFAAALLTKEDGLIIPLLLTLLSLFPGGRRRGWGKILPLLPLYAGAFVFYYWALPRLYLIKAPGEIYGLMSQGDYARAQIEVLYRYLGLCFLPHPLNIDHQIFPATTAGGKILEIAGLIGLFGLIAFLAWLWRRRPLMSLGLLSFFALLLPTSSLIPLTTTMDEHRLYLPLGFFGLAFFSFVLFLFQQTLFQRRWPEATRLAAYGFFLLIAVANGIGSNFRNPLWRSEKFLWQESLEQNPDNLRAYINLSYLASRRGDALEARAMALEAIQRNPYYYVPYLNLGIAYAYLKEYEAAKRAFERSLSLHPNYILALYNLGWLAVQNRDYAAARDRAEQILRLQPGHDLGLFLLRALPAKDGRTFSAPSPTTPLSGSTLDFPAPVPAGAAALPPPPSPGQSLARP